jgi:uncharacterized membrane protein HdeD (DUF308 family)
VFLLRGFVAILFGICAFAWPGMTLIVLVALFAAFVFVDGVATLIAAITHRGEVKHWWAYLLEGLLGIGVGVATWFWPGLTAMVLLFLIAFWAVATGLFEIIAAWKLREEIRGEWALAIAGLLSVAFGVMLFVRPGAGALAVVWVIGLYAVLFGILLLAVAFKLRALQSKIEDVTERVAETADSVKD